MDALRTQFRDAMSRLGAAVNIITTIATMRAPRVVPTLK